MDEFEEWLDEFAARMKAEKELRWEHCSREAWLEATRLADRKAREEIIDLIEQYKVPIGNSAAGEMACEFTMDALADIRDKVCDTIKEEPS